MIIGYGGSTYESYLTLYQKNFDKLLHLLHTDHTFFVSNRQSCAYRRRCCRHFQPIHDLPIFSAFGAGRPTAGHFHHPDRLARAAALSGFPVRLLRCFYRYRDEAERRPLGPDRALALYDAVRHSNGCLSVPSPFLQQKRNHKKAAITRRKNRADASKASARFFVIEAQRGHTPVLLSLPEKTLAMRE